MDRHYGTSKKYAALQKSRLDEDLKFRKELYPGRNTVLVSDLFGALSLDYGEKSSLLPRISPLLCLTLISQPSIMIDIYRGGKRGKAVKGKCGQLAVLPFEWKEQLSSKEFWKLTRRGMSRGRLQT